MSLVGLFTMLLVAWIFSENRRKISWRIVAWGLALQFSLALLVLRTELGRTFFYQVNSAVDVLTTASNKGASLVFGKLPSDFSIGATMAFQVLPVIIFVSALAAILQHLRVIQFFVNIMAWVMRRTMKTSGAETFAAALQVFFGIESLPASRGYLEEMTRSELFVIMTTFMGTIASSVMVAYTLFGAEAGHLLCASLMAAPAGLMISKIMVPETGHPKTDGTGAVTIRVDSHNIVDAAALGTGDGLQLALNVGAMLIAFVALVELCDISLLNITQCITGHGVTFSDLMSWFFRPVAFIMGVPHQDINAVAQLLGKKTVLNEFIAYADLKPMIAAGTLQARSITIATYALCSFANPGSLAILIAAMTRLLPNRRAEVVSLSMKSFLAGALTSFMTACIAGVMMD